MNRELSVAVSTVDVHGGHDVGDDPAHQVALDPSGTACRMLPYRSSYQRANFGVPKPLEASTANVDSIAFKRASWL